MYQVGESVRLVEALALATSDSYGEWDREVVFPPGLEGRVIGVLLLSDRVMIEVDFGSGLTWFLAPFRLTTA